MQLHRFHVSCNLIMHIIYRTWSLPITRTLYSLHIYNWNAQIHSLYSQDYYPSPRLCLPSCKNKNKHNVLMLFFFLISHRVHSTTTLWYTLQAKSLLLRTHCAILHTAVVAAHLNSSHISITDLELCPHSPALTQLMSGGSQLTVKVLAVSFGFLLAC